VPLIMFFLGAMGSGPIPDWQVHVLGYLASIGLIGATIWVLPGRIAKLEVHQQRSPIACRPLAMYLSVLSKRAVPFPERDTLPARSSSERSLAGEEGAEGVRQGSAA